LRYWHSIFVVLSSSAVLAAPPEQFPAVRAQASALLRQGRIAEAVPNLERAFRINPQDYSNGYDLALAYLKTGRVDDARQQARRLVDKPEVDSLLAEIEMAANRPNEAVVHLRRAAERDPSEMHLLALGNFLVLRGASSDAVKIYRWAIERHPRSSPLRVGLGVALHAESQYDEAVQSLCDAVDLDPRDPRPLEFLGKMHDVSPQLAAQVSARLKSFVDRYPQNSLAHLYYGLSLWKLEASQPAADAEKHLTTAVRLDPKSAEAQLQLGSFYEAHKKDALAAKALESAVQLDPASEKALYRLGQVYRRLGRSEDANRVTAAFRRLKENSKR
jgi:Flp pilus assembly protein TadD